MLSCTKCVTGIAALRSKWAAGKARRGSISESIRDRGATQPPAHFQRNPPGCASFGRLLCRSSVEDHSGYSPSSLRASIQNTQQRRYTSHGLGTLVRDERYFGDLRLGLLQLPDICDRVLNFIVREQGANCYLAMIAFTAVQLRHSSCRSLDRPGIGIAGAWLEAGDVSCLRWRLVLP